MEKKEELQAAKILARLTVNGFSVFAQYDYLAGNEIFKGIMISPKCKEASDILIRITELITNHHGLVTKKGG